jgi:3-hydroxybutyrate dehydrogenase
MSRPDDIYAMVEAVASELGPVDILVNNAGVQHVAPIPEFSNENWDMVLATNLSSAFHCTKAVPPAMLSEARTVPALAPELADRV